MADLANLGLDEGGHLLVTHGLDALSPGERLTVTGSHPALGIHLAAWCREHGHQVAWTDAGPSGSPRAGRAGGTADDTTVVIVKGSAGERRWQGAERAGLAAGPPAAHANAAWGLAARGALVEAGGPPIGAQWSERDHVWADIAPQLYAAAAASQWDPATAVDWTAPLGGAPPEVERAVVQLMTYLVENEQAALIIPARLLSQLHPHYREVMQLLATQAADEARHVEVFTRRAVLSGGEPGTSSAGGRASLQTLLDEPDFTTAAFLLSVLGEGTFLDLLRFIAEHAPDQVTADVTRLAARDEARHVAFGVAHTAHLARADRHYLGTLRQAVERRHAALRDTAGLNAEVFGALVLLGAGSWSPEAIRRGWAAVRDLQDRMDEGRRRRLAAIGFPDDEAAELSALHTRNFM
ncbi:ferritin-like domain-containing protein [Trebonia kvetii]|uniref:Ferritin-like domain-containing protein n=1 Tax=Trebonia kvetii TaxID=2480626 RepID=A0A6P2BPE9_9ACTN|nr:ferritin-like domain-containing protein [Trebonia kvetii]